MKSKIILPAIILSFIFCFSAQAQLSVGPGAVYGTDIDNIGISLNGTYQFNETWVAAPSFTYFLKKNNVNWMVLDLDGNYVFTEIENLGSLYALAGLSLTFWSFDYDSDYFDFDTSGSDAGINIGAGLKLNLDEKIDILPEIRYTLGDADYIRISVKVLFSLGGLQSSNN